MRRLVALALGLAASTLLLGGGWLWAGLREREGRLREAEARLARDADLVRAAVDESLEELRVREDERPFYLYNHFYSPPDVLAITDPVALSPLARAPADARLVGHFQIEPGGVVRTPYEADDEVEAAPTALSARIAAIVRGAAFAPLFERARGEGTATMLAPRGGPPPPALAAPLPAPEGELLGVQVAAAEAPATEPLTVALNRWGNVQAQDIAAAQSGDPEANARVMDRGRQVPIISRRNVGWDGRDAPRSAAQQQDSLQEPRAAWSPPPQGGTGPRVAEVHRAFDALAGAVRACTAASDVRVRLRVRGRDGVPDNVTIDGVEVATERACAEDVLRGVRLQPFGAPSALVRYAFRAGTAAAPAAPEVSRSVGLENLVQREAEVDYTPLVYREVGEALVLERVVSHGGVSIVQGVLLDLEHVRARWIPSLVERHAEPGALPSVVVAGGGRCAVRRPASRIVRGVELCFGPSALASLEAELDAELRWQLAALLALCLGALLAALLMVSAARRAEALSRQKSAFVSAVSHELRTPLTTLRMHAEMLDEGMVSEERRPRVHRELVRESVRLARLVDNVLSLSRLEEGQRRLHREDGDLAAHVREVAEGQRGFVEERGFSLRAPSREPVSARYDAQAVEQIVVNLLDNAVKYGAGEERAIEVAVELVAGAPTIFVRDRGPGVPEAERERVFVRFHRVERAEHAHAPGTGIGLALVAELALAHGGKASVHPREGGGLEVRVTLGA